ncbi:Ulp1-like peptidase [Cucumis melo var. makuwa]|uniref:Ulp1-like peptidase n=1 Tax=Cucumis melo var. makuwa TaxID=1194695 RepID=A0A5D3DSX0_CUCMM|nr:Ulp1-like peptidase [Cucumis melo var. makuwa]
MVVPSDKYFTVTVSCQVHKIGSLIKDRLTKEQLQMLEKTIFGPFLNVNMVFNGQLIYHFLLRQIPEESNVALAVFIETMMVGKDKKAQFDMDILGRVDDEEIFKSFDWSTFFYTRLLNNLKTSLQGKKEAYELKKTKSSKVVTYYNIKPYVLAFQMSAYEVLSSASEHLTTRNSKGLIPMILRWNCTQAPSYKMLQKNIFDNKNTVMKTKLKLSTQEKAFMESRIRGDDNIQMEDDESIPDINNSDTNTSDHAINNKSLEQLDSSPQLSPQRKQSQTVADL